jgi:thiol-disulfide isomerase/thioredoxin
MIKVSVFGKQECDACKAAVEKMTYFSRKWGKGESTSIDFVDMETVDGLAEGAYRDVYDIPTVILEDGGLEVARWVKKVPASAEFREYFMKEDLNDGSGDKGFC